MRVVVQRVKKAFVLVKDEKVGEIGEGLCILLGVGQGDTEADADYLADKTANLRIFEDAAGKMNLSCLDIQGEMLIISQFTLYGDCRKGRRPSFSTAAQPDEANRLYEYFVAKIRDLGIRTATGVFGEEMLVEIQNHGPVTLLLDSAR